MTRRHALTLGVPLDRDHESAVRAIRRRLGVPRGRTEACPHVSLLVLLEVPSAPELDAAVDAVAARTPIFSVRARGLGVFHDDEGGLVLYVPVVRTPQLARLHRDLYESVTATRAKVDGHYAPASWFPHVTLWDRMPTPEAMAEAIRALTASPPLAWTLPVTCLARLEASGMTAAFPLAAGRGPGR